MCWVQPSSLVRSKRHGTACAIGHKGEARILSLHAPWGPYIQEVIYMGSVQLSSLVRPKRHGTACVISPKGEARTLGPRAPSVPKAKLGHLVRYAIGPKGEARILGLRAPWGPYIQEVIYMGWVQLSSLVRSKRHGTACAICPKGEARTLGLRAPLVPKAKLGHLVCVQHRSQRRS